MPHMRAIRLCRHAIYAILRYAPAFIVYDDTTLDDAAAAFSFSLLTLAAVTPRQSRCCRSVDAAMPHFRLMPRLTRFASRYRFHTLCRFYA